MSATTPPARRLPAHLSVSSVQLYARCPRAWKRRYVEGIAEPPTPAMAFGKAFAIAMEALHRGEDAEMTLLRAYRAAPAAAPSLEHGLALLDLYRAHGVYQGVPERRFQLHLPGGVVPVPVLGFMDLECADDDQVIEVKTSRNPWSQARADAEYQAAVYAWAFRQLHGRRPKHVRYLIFSTRAVDLQVLDTSPTGSELRLFELAAATTWRGIRAGRFDGCGRCTVCRPPEDAAVPLFEVGEGAR